MQPMESYAEHVESHVLCKQFHTKIRSIYVYKRSLEFLLPSFLLRLFSFTFSQFGPARRRCQLVLILIKDTKFFFWTDFLMS